MQFAHPKIAAGVSEHSTVEVNPFERIRSTAIAMRTIGFGSPTERERVLKQLDAIHAQVQGRLPTGEHYDARAPDLLLWVLATLIDTRLLVDERYGGQLSPADRDRYYDEFLVLARAFRIPMSEVPKNLTAFRSWIDLQVASLEVTEPARRLAPLVLRPPFARLPAPVWSVTRWVTSDLLPLKIREGYRLSSYRYLKPMLRMMQVGSRMIFPRLPRRIRDGPHLFDIDRPVAA